ncbi:MAG: glutamyl-tRNA amidotransferase [Kordia sp.]|nr:MAG: glutamyl-tRNA amidotransferase [Kordia sp.]
MSLQTDIMTKLKEAMKAKDQVALTSLRAIKAELLLAQTSSGSKRELSEAEEVKLIQKLVKQRKDSAVIFTEQNRPDLATPELEQVAVIEQFLPEQFTEGEVEKIVLHAIEELGASGMKDMGKVMAAVNAEVAGQADGKTISVLVKKNLM